LGTAPEPLLLLPLPVLESVPVFAAALKLPLAFVAVPCALLLPLLPVLARVLALGSAPEAPLLRHVPVEKVVST
jgi:hypothetical protein